MDEMLKYAIENGIVDLSYIREMYEMNKREEILREHPYKIWEGKDGKWYTYLPDKENGRVQRVRKTRKEIEDVIIEYLKREMENPTIEEAFEEWNDRKLSLNKISAATHKRNKQVFRRHYKEFGMRRIKSLSSDEIGDFLEEQIPKLNLSAKAFSNLKTVTRGFLKRAKKRGFISFDVDDMFNQLDTSDSDFKKTIKEDYEEVFDEEETDLMIKYLKENLDPKNIGILLMFVTGIRVGELVALKHEVIDGNTIKIRRTETRYLSEDNKDVYDVKDYPKTGAGVRTVVVPKDYEWILQIMKYMNPFGEYVFVDKNGNRMKTYFIRKRLSLICEKLGIYKKSPHKIRKTYGTILLDNNVDQRLIIGQMGHTDIVCTENHYHRNRRSINNKQNVLSSIKEFQNKVG